MTKEYKTCSTCKYKASLIGLGQGVRCWNPKNTNRVFVGKMNLELPLIPGLNKCCEHWKKIDHDAKV